MTVLGAARRVAGVAAAGTTIGGLLAGGYLTLIGVAATRSLRRSRETTASGTATTRFRILVPAHNEEAMIAETLDSLRSLAYPEDRFEIHVVADNCSDRTAQIAADTGVHVHVRDAPDRPGKGPALVWLLERLPEGDPDDVIVVVDADTIVDPSLLVAFERALARDHVVQGHYMVRDAEVGGDVGFRAAALAVRHLVRPAGRTGLGGSSSLYGNGMAFRERIARSYPWSDDLTEDLDLGLRLLLDGHRVGFTPDAIVAAEMPASREGAVSQHERWEAGRLRVARKNLPSLTNAAIAGAHGRRWTYVDAAIDIALPPLTTVVAATTVGGIGMAALSNGRVRIVGVGTAAVALGLQVVHVLHALELDGAPPAVRRSLLRAPAQIVWKSRLLARVARTQPASWNRTSREAERPSVPEERTA